MIYTYRIVSITERVPPFCNCPIVLSMAKAHECINLFLLPRFGYFCCSLRKKPLYVGVLEMLIYNQNNY